MVHFRDFIGKNYKLYLTKEDPNYAFFRLNNTWVVLADGCRRFDFKSKFECINAKEYFNQEYIDSVEWVGPFPCTVTSSGFIATESCEYCDCYFEENDVIASIDEECFYICSNIYNGGSLENLL